MPETFRRHQSCQKRVDGTKVASEGGAVDGNGDPDEPAAHFELVVHDGGSVSLRSAFPASDSAAVGGSGGRRGCSVHKCGSLRNKSLKHGMLLSACTTALM